MSEVSRTPTPLAPDELVRIFLEAHPGPVPSRHAMAYLLGIIGVENARGHAIIQHNWGNIMAGEGWRASGKDYWPSPVSDPAQPAFFRSYPDHLAGARAWWELMYRRFQGVIQAALTCDAAAVARALYHSKPAYVVGGSESAYANGIASVAKEWLPIVLRIGPPLAAAAFVSSVFALGVTGIALVVRYS